MADELILTLSSPDDGRDLYAMLQEIGPGENGFHNGAYNLSWRAFEGYLRGLQREARGWGLAENRVPQSTFWLRRNDYPLGLIKVRHGLNEALRVQGGHIGYSIRPSERGKGYGTRMLGLGLGEARRLGLSKVLITCFENNIPSRRMAERFGGRLTKTDAGTCYYWLEL